MEFQASIAGAKIKSGPGEESKSQDGETLEDRLRRRKQEKQMKEGAVSGEAKSPFGAGQGYKVIGGR